MLNSSRLLTVALLLCSAVTFAAEKKKAAPTLHPVGFGYRKFATPTQFNWRGSKEQVLDGVVWYPAESGDEAKEQLIGPPDAPLFSAGRSTADAVLAPSFGKYALVVLSHGTGGSAMQMAWLGTYLAARGYIVAAVNHPGNNALTGYTTQGFIEGWERAKDITTVISDLLADSRLGEHIDAGRIGAAGFSYGGYTMLELAGATTDFNQLRAWCDPATSDQTRMDQAKIDQEKKRCDPPEMPDLMDRFKAIEHQPEVQNSIRISGASYRDPRIRAVFAIAPAVARAFLRESLQKITIPVEIVAGASDSVAPPAENAQFFAENIKGAKLTILPGGVGHYTFLDVGTQAGKQQLPQFFVDNEGVDRESVHAQVAEMAALFFDRELTPPKTSKKKP